MSVKVTPVELGNFFQAVGEVMVENNVKLDDVVDEGGYSSELLHKLARNGIDPNRAYEVIETCTSLCDELVPEYVDTETVEGVDDDVEPEDGAAD